MTLSRPIRAALYARVSTTGKGQDVELQLSELRMVAAHRQWSATEYVDEGVSGSKERRPGLDKLMADARAGKVDIVAVWRFDRFARDTKHLVNALDEFQRLNVEFLSLREQLDTSSPMGRAMFSIIAALSQLERDVIKERVIAGVNRAKAAGKHLGRPRKRVPVEAAVALLREGRSLRDVSVVLGIHRNVVRDRLRDAGLWPVPTEAVAADPDPSPAPG